MSEPPKRVSRALVAGAVGRQGEALLNAVLSFGGYSEVAVLTDQSVRLGIARLVTCTSHDLAPAQDMFMLIGGDGVNTKRSFHGRDAPFVELDEHTALALATRAVQSGVKRIVLLSASPSWQQFGAVHRGLSSPLERALSQLPISRFVVMHPVLEARSAGASLMQRFVNFYLSIQLLMVPRSVPTLTSVQIANAAVKSLAESQVHGVAVFSAADMGRLLVSKASG